MENHNRELIDGIVKWLKPATAWISDTNQTINFLWRMMIANMFMTLLLTIVVFVLLTRR